MKTVSLFDLVEKLASIDTNPKQLFFYIPLDTYTVEHLTSIRKTEMTLPDDAETQDFDHVTLLYIPKSVDDIESSKVDTIVKDARDVVADHPTIHARIQGWAYFDGAEKDGEKVTALVALLDAPGLEDLHVELKSLMKRLGFPPSGAHSFTPHITFAYLPHGKRVDKLPPISQSFDIDKAMLANGEKHELPLKGNLGVAAAKAASLGDAAFLAVPGALTGALAGAIGGGEGHRLSGAGRGALGGAAAGALGGRYMPIGHTLIERALTAAPAAGAAGGYLAGHTAKEADLGMAAAKAASTK